MNILKTYYYYTKYLLCVYNLEASDDYYTKYIVITSM